MSTPLFIRRFHVDVRCSCAADAVLWLFVLVDGLAGLVVVYAEEETYKYTTGRFLFIFQLSEANLGVRTCQCVYLERS